MGKPTNIHVIRTRPEDGQEPTWDGSPIRPTVVDIDLAALVRNFAALRALAGIAEVMAVVKADAYGHGAVACSRALEKAGARFFGVALTEEALELREAGIRGRIVVLGGAYGTRFDLLVAKDLTPLVFRAEHLAGLAAAARALGRPAVAHVKLDTGMGRIGLSPTELAAFAAAAKVHGVRLEGLASHFASADLFDEEVTTRQLASFAEGAEVLRAAGHELAWLHVANSAGLVDRPDARGTLARPGVTLYGHYPSDKLKDRVRVEPVLRFSTAITHLKRVPAGTPISYGGRFVTARPSTIATIPVGYADGWDRALTNVGEALVRGVRAKVAGTVCMDQTMLDVTDVPEVSVGDEVVLIGRQGEQEISAADVAALCGTIHYETLTGISPRVPRRFAGG